MKNVNRVILEFDVVQTRERDDAPFAPLNDRAVIEAMHHMFTNCMDWGEYLSGLPDRFWDANNYIDIVPTQVSLKDDPASAVAIDKD